MTLYNTNVIGQWLNVYWPIIVYLYCMASCLITQCCFFLVLVTSSCSGCLNSANNPSLEKNLLMYNPYFVTILILVRGLILLAKEKKRDNIFLGQEQ